jgi:acyl transferase domain-containing protein
VIDSAASSTSTNLLLDLHGQGFRHPHGRELCATEPVFREAIDDCAALAAGPLGLDLAAAFADLVQAI